MGINVYPPVYPKKNIELLTSGSSWTVPSGVTKVVAKLVGGGGGGGGSQSGSATHKGGAGNPGQVTITTLTTTPGGTISYTIGAGGTAGTTTGSGGTGGTTTFTGATSALGGNGGRRGVAIDGAAGTDQAFAPNGGQAGHGDVSTAYAGGTGGAGYIELEYWV